MRVFLLIALAVAMIALCEARSLTEQDYQQQFTNFVTKYNKQYPHDEFFNRYSIFKANLDYIRAHNKGKHTYSLAVNEFTDMTFVEFHDRYTGYTPRDTTYYRAKNAAPKHHSTLAAPASVDWRTSNAVTPIKNQGQCGSCWAFSTTGSVEGAVAIGSGQLISLSEQQLVDCSSSYGNQGCNGGLMDDAFQYIIANGGVDTEASYPYTAEDGTCHYSKANNGATLASYTDVTSGSETALTNDCGTYGPISVAIDASHSSFQFYSGGVYYEPDCSSTQLDHGVLAVGYGTLSGQAYYIVKNSWGTDWGLEGYIYMSRNRNNNCGIATMASWPTA